MIWSYSRLSAYYECPHAWKRHYIDEEPELDNFYGQFGTLCHEVLEKYLNGELDVFDVSQYYEDHFYDVVTMMAPYNAYVDLLEKYYNKGLEYFETIDMHLEPYEILGIERKETFKVDEYDMRGTIDLLLRDKETGEITVYDHKSATIKILKNGNISKKCAEKFESYKKQLYLYSIPVIEQYGRVDYLTWNAFKDGNIITVPFKEEEFEAAKKWVVDTIHLIENDTEFVKKDEPMGHYCSYVCGYRKACDRSYFNGDNEHERN